METDYIVQLAEIVEEEINKKKFWMNLKIFYVVTELIYKPEVEVEGQKVIKNQFSSQRVEYALGKCPTSYILYWVIQPKFKPKYLIFS